MDEQEIEKEVPQFLAHLPAYGIIKIHTRKDGIIPEEVGYAQSIPVDLNKDVNIISYLDDNGFLSYVYYLPEIAIQLTDKGRKLKELGSMEEYRIYEMAYKNEVAAAKEREKNLYRVSIALLLVSSIAALYYLLDILNHFFCFYPH